MKLQTSPYLQTPPVGSGIRPFGDIELDPSMLDQFQRDYVPPVDMQIPDMTELDPQAVQGPAQPHQGTMEDDQWSQVGEALLNDTVAPVGESQGGGGIGLGGTLGILNLGAGLGSQIYKMATAKKAKKPRRAVPMPSGNPFR